MLFEAKTIPLRFSLDFLWIILRKMSSIEKLFEITKTSLGLTWNVTEIKPCNTYQQLPLQ